MIKSTVFLLGVCLSICLSACTPEIKVTAPTEPITINLNVKVQHEILVKIDKEVDTLLKDNSLF